MSSKRAGGRGSTFLLKTKFVHGCLCVSMGVYVCACAYMRVRGCVCVCMCVCMGVMCVHVFGESHFYSIFKCIYIKNVVITVKVDH